MSLRLDAMDGDEIINSEQPPQPPFFPLPMDKYSRRMNDHDLERDIMMIMGGKRDVKKKKQTKHDTSRRIDALLKLSVDELVVKDHQSTKGRASRHSLVTMTTTSRANHHYSNGNTRFFRSGGEQQHVSSWRHARFVLMFWWILSLSLFVFASNRGSHLLDDYTTTTRKKKNNNNNFRRFAKDQRYSAHDDNNGDEEKTMVIETKHVVAAADNSGLVMSLLAKDANQEDNNDEATTVPPKKKDLIGHQRGRVGGYHHQGRANTRINSVGPQARTLSHQHHYRHYRHPTLPNHHDGVVRLNAAASPSIRGHTEATPEQESEKTDTKYPPSSAVVVSEEGSSGIHQEGGGKNDDTANTKTETESTPEDQKDATTLVE